MNTRARNESGSSNSVTPKVNLFRAATRRRTITAARSAAGKKQILPPTPVPSAGSRYISFAIDSVTLSLFRDLSFTLDKGNTATLAHIIETCARMGDEEFQRFPESQVVIGTTKRTMSFLMPRPSLDTLQTLAQRLRIRNKSALYRYLIQLMSRQGNVGSELYLRSNVY